MDVGIVCDQCDAFNAMAAATCISCGNGLSLQTPRRAAPTPPHSPIAPPAQPKRPSNAISSSVPAVSTAAPAAFGVGGTPTGGTPTGGDTAGEIDPAQAKGSAGNLRICKECGNPIQPGFRFCGTCGAPVERATARKPTNERRTQYFGAMQAARAKLVLIKGDGLDGVSYTLAGQDHIAGRTEGPLLFQDDPFLSPRHANFYYRDGKLHVRDEVSANGVYVRIRVPTPLRSGDTFLIGEQVIRVESTPPETAGLGPDEDGTYVFASPRRASRMRLVQLLRGGDIGLCMRASGEVVILGRDGNDVNFPDDPFISGRHAQVAISDQGLVLTDLGSKNGTFLRIRAGSGQGAGPGPGNDAPLVHGDYVFMGQQLLRVEIVA